MAPLAIVSREHELGRSTHASRSPVPALAPVMYRDLIGFEQESATFSSWLEAPRPALTLMIDLDGAISADRRALPDAWFSGLSHTYTVVEFSGRYASIDLELNPLGAYRVLGFPVSELRSTVVSLEDLWGAAGRELTERVRLTTDWDQRFDLVEEFLLARVSEGPEPTPAVEAAFAALRATGGQARVDAIVSELGCSRRYLSKRFGAEVGLPPKTLARLIRFEHVTRRLRSAPASWAEIAADAGYSDQPHLNREFRDLAGITPSEFVARLMPSGVNGDDVPPVGDAEPCPNLQDAG